MIRLAIVALLLADVVPPGAGGCTGSGDKRPERLPDPPAWMHHELGPCGVLSTLPSEKIEFAIGPHDLCAVGAAQGITSPSLRRNQASARARAELAKAGLVENVVLLAEELRGDSAWVLYAGQLREAPTWLPKAAGPCPPEAVGPVAGCCAICVSATAPLRDSHVAAFEEASKAAKSLLPAGARPGLPHTFVSADRATLHVLFAAEGPEGPP